MTFDTRIILYSKGYFIFFILFLLQVECLPLDNENIKSEDDIDKTYEEWMNEPQCNDTTLCEDVTNEELKLINKAVTQKNFKFEGIIDKTKLIVQTNRSTNVCDSKKQLLRPRKGQTMDKKWLIVVNNEQFTQAISVNICINKNNACKFSTSDSNSKTWCQQDYIERHLVAITSNGKISKEVFLIPAGCCCHGAWL